MDDVIIAMSGLHVVLLRRDGAVGIILLRTTTRVTQIVRLREMMPCTRKEWAVWQSIAGQVTPQVKPALRAKPCRKRASANPHLYRAGPCSTRLVGHRGLPHGFPPRPAPQAALSKRLYAGAAARRKP